MKPAGVEVLSHEDGLILFLPVRERWWQLWKPKQVVRTLTRDGVIWLRQVIFKVMQEQVSEGGWTERDELAADLRRATEVLVEFTLDDQDSYHVADMLWQKGYRK
jgi:hypothetical protein